MSRTILVIFRRVVPDWEFLKSAQTGKERTVRHGSKKQQDVKLMCCNPTTSQIIQCAIPRLLWYLTLAAVRRHWVMHVRGTLELSVKPDVRGGSGYAARGGEGGSRTAE